MAEARVRDEWSRTSSLLALIANVNRPRNRTPLKPSDFDPTTKTQCDKHVSLPGAGARADNELLKQIFIRNRNRKDST